MWHNFAHIYQICTVCINKKTEKSSDQFAYTVSQYTCGKNVHYLSSHQIMNMYVRRIMGWCASIMCGQ